MNLIKLLIAVLLLTTFSTNVSAQQGSVGTLSGEIRVGHDPSFKVDRGDVRATFQGASVTKINFVNGHAGSFEMQLGTPVTPTVYQVSSELIFENGIDLIRFAPRAVSVNPGETSIYDIVVDEPGFVQGSIQVPGATVASAMINVTRPDGSSTAQTNTNAARNFDYSMPVVPGEQLRVAGSAILSTGAEVFFPPQTVSIAPGETVSVNLSGNAPTVGSVFGSFQFPGAAAVDQFRYQLSGPAFFSTNITAVENSGTHSVESLPVGSYIASLRAFLGNGDDEVLFPHSAYSPSSLISVIAGTERSQTIAAAQAAIVGTVTVSGSIQAENVEGGQVLMLGLPGSAAADAQSLDRLSVPSLDYDNIVMAGQWFIDSLRLTLVRPASAGYLRQSFILKDLRTKDVPLTVSSGESLRQDLAYRFSERQFLFDAPAGQLISAPRVTANCTRKDSAGQVLWTSTSVSFGDVSNVSSATVSVANVDGDCTFVADARIANLLTVLGSGTVNFVAGSQGSIDAGGPSLRVTEPMPEICIGSASIDVSGVATDDSFVQSVVINSMSAALNSTENITDPAEVRFSATIPLQLGSNTIQTLVTDGSGKESLDIRSIVRSEDSDADGTLDCDDQCPTDPAKIAPGVCGCNISDVDTDGDGALDCTESCAADPLKTEAGVCGCGVADSDTDGDGTLDCFDQCASDPLKTSAGICGCGQSDADTDGDGLADCLDFCPVDPLKQDIGICGCGVSDVDSDGDGVADCLDICAADPLKSSPGVCGCGVSDVDSDHDGVSDCNDLCPADAGKTAPMVCGCGVSDLDSDGDGVPDCLDSCPADASKVLPGVCGCGVVDSDNDGDGYYSCEGDCNDNDPTVYPGAIEACGDVDKNCDGKVGALGEFTIRTFEEYLGNLGKITPEPMEIAFYPAEPSSCAMTQCGKLPKLLQYACVERKCQPTAFAGSVSGPKFGTVKTKLLAGKYIALALNSPQIAMTNPFVVSCGASVGGDYHRVSLILLKRAIPLLDWFDPEK